jgi:hypothetical protein
MTGSRSPGVRGLGWRAPILMHFTPEIAAATRLTVVADPDLLLTEQEVIDALRDRGYDLVPFDDHVAFRFAYESRYRRHWDRGDTTNLVVVLRTSRDDLSCLPFDLLSQAKRHERCLSFTIGALFPDLVPTIVGELERADFDALYEAQRQQESGALGVNDTKDFILRHVFAVAPELINTPADLLGVLLRRHYAGRSFPASLDERFIHLLVKRGRWADWPLEQIVPSRAAFLAFLQERWPHFLKSRVAAAHSAREPAPPYGLRFQGPIDLPFDHDVVKIYIDNLFLEGHLVPTDAVDRQEVSDPWMLVGVVAEDAATGELERFVRLSERVEKELPAPEADHRAWSEYSRVWAEWAAARWQHADHLPAAVRSTWDALHDTVEAAFAGWVSNHYASLHNLSFVKRPVMVHHVPHHIAREFTRTGAGPAKRHALLVVDGLALDQWVPIRHALRTQLATNVHVEEDVAFAWVPTLTGISRQSIFAGEPPFLFGGSLGSTHKEPDHWQRFWEERGATRAEIGYVCQKRQEPDAVFFERVRTVVDHPKMRMLGVVVGTVDQSMHGVVTGTRGLHSLVRDWAQSGALARLITSLLDGDYDVFVTADHGNIEALGVGKPNVGAVADERGERAHVFADDLSREAVRAQYPGSVAWPSIGLPDTYRALLAPGRGAFIHEGKTTVAHGGIALEEVLVPFVRIQRGAG